MNIDFSAILADASGVIDWFSSVLNTGIFGTILGIAFAIYKAVKKYGTKVSADTGNFKELVSKAIAEALPNSEIKIKLEAIAKREFAELTGQLKEECAKNLEQAKDNEQLLKDIATALICLKSVPDSVKDKLADDIGSTADKFENKIILALKPSVSEGEKEQEPEITVVEQEYVE